MSSSDIANTIIIIVIFAIINIIAILSIGISHIENNWNKYKCKPMIIPLAGVFGHNTATNFKECVQNIEQSFLSDLLTPLYSVFNELSSVGSEIGSFMNIVNTLGGQFQMGFMGGISQLYDKVNNLILGTTNVGIKFSDLVGKISGIMYSIILMLETINVLGLSIACGLPGSVVKTATGTSPCPELYSEQLTKCYLYTNEISCNSVPAKGLACSNQSDTDCGNYCWYDTSETNKNAPKCKNMDSSCSYLDNWEPNSDQYVYSNFNSWEDVSYYCEHDLGCKFHPASGDDPSHCKPKS